jgi:hypothetical protein
MSGVEVEWSVRWVWCADEDGDVDVDADFSIVFWCFVLWSDLLVLRCRNKTVRNRCKNLELEIQI